jgi:transcriptional regulator with XRE-family HTH domain
MASQQTQQPISEALPDLLREHGTNQWQFAKRVGVSAQFLGRALNHREGKRIGGELAGRIAEELGLPRDYFPEFREWRAVVALRENPELREQVYRALGEIRKQP